MVLEGLDVHGDQNETSQQHGGEQDEQGEDLLLFRRRILEVVEQNEKEFFPVVGDKGFG